MNTPSDKAKSLDEILAEMQAVAEKATSGPWGHNESNNKVWTETPVSFTDEIAFDVRVHEDSIFIAKSREAVPRLIQALRIAIEQRNEAYQKPFTDDELAGPWAKLHIEGLNTELAKLLQGRS